MADVGFLGMAESAQPRNRHMAKADETNRDRVVITLFSTLSSLHPVRVTHRSLVSATPPPRKHTRVGYFDGMGIGRRSVKVTGPPFHDGGGPFLGEVTAIIPGYHLL